MTQTLDARERLPDTTASHAVKSPTQSASTAETGTTDKFAVFAITFAIAFAILYTQLERLNWPFFTYHPAVGKVDFWMHPARSGEGPPMYWYGWLALSIPGAAILGWAATLLSLRALLRTTVFACSLFVLWSAIYACWAFMDERTKFDTDLLKSIAWMSGIPAVVAAGALSYFVPIRWAERSWTSWMLITPIVGLIILGYSLKTYFLR